MKESHNIQKLDAVNLGIPLFSVVAIWLVYWSEIKFGYVLNNFGIAPKTFIGLRGILFSPLIHGSIQHLYSNTIPLFLLSLSLFYFYRKLAFNVIIYGWLLSGLLTWLIGEEGSHHIGASGLIYVFASFLFFKGIWSKNYRLMSLSFVVVFLYGSLVWGVLPGVPGISWEGHLAGFITGLLLALVYRRVIIAEKKKYSWEQDSYDENEDEFMKHFDENGNFIPSSELYTEDSVETLGPVDSTNNFIEIVYEFKINKENENN